MYETRQLAFDELYGSSVVEEQLGIDDAFPERFADELSHWEAFNKHLYRPNTYLHKWWARRCGSTFRAILKQLSSDPARRVLLRARWAGGQGRPRSDDGRRHDLARGDSAGRQRHRRGRGPDSGGASAGNVEPGLSGGITGPPSTASSRRCTANWKRIFKLHVRTATRMLDLQYTLYGLRRMCACGEVVQIDQYELRYEADRVMAHLRRRTGRSTTDSMPSSAAPSRPLRLVTEGRDGMSSSAARSTGICSTCPFTLAMCRLPSWLIAQSTVCSSRRRMQPIWRDCAAADESRDRIGFRRSRLASP